MTLDIATLDDEGKPFKSIRLDVDSHHDLIEAAGNRFKTILRFAEYHDDAEFQVSELGNLKSELEALKAHLASDSLITKVNEIINKILYAQEHQKTLYFIAD